MKVYRVATAALAVVAAVMTGAVVGTLAGTGVAQASGPFTCKSGFVWREAVPGDQVCVSPQARELARAEKQAGPGNTQGAGHSGKDTCKSGFVWREARPDDHVCVAATVPAGQTPPRNRVRTENGVTIRNYANLEALPPGGASVDTERHQLGGRVFGSGTGLTRGGTVEFWAARLSASGPPVQVGTLTPVGADGTLRRALLSDVRKMCGAPQPVVIMAVDRAGGRVMRAGTSAAWAC